MPDMPALDDRRRALRDQLHAQAGTMREVQGIDASQGRGGSAYRGSMPSFCGAYETLSIEAGGSPMTVQIRLTYGDMVLAGLVGVERNASNFAKGKQDRNGEARNPWQIAITGCLAELAAAKYLNLNWDGDLMDYGARDVGGLVQVRATDNKQGCLLLHEWDADADPFLFAVIHRSEVALIGWIFGHEGKQKDYWKDPVGGRPCYFVPQSALRPMDDLRAYLILKRHSETQREAAQ